MSKTNPALCGHRHVEYAAVAVWIGLLGAASPSVGSAQDKKLARIGVTKVVSHAAVEAALNTVRLSRSSLRFLKKRAIIFIQEALAAVKREGKR